MARRAISWICCPIREHELTRYFDSEAASYLTEAEKATTISAGLSSNGALYAFPFWAVSVAIPGPMAF